LAPVEPADNGIAARPDDPCGADASARLLLALTALYVQRSNHSAQEQQQYTELVLGLIDKAGPAARAAAAARLCRQPDAPGTVIECLGGDARLSPDGGGDDGQPPASADPRVRCRPPEQGRVESDLSPAVSARHLVGQEQQQSQEPAQEPAQEPEQAAIGKAPLTPEFGEAFFAASPVERRRMLSAITGTDSIKADADNDRRFHVIGITPWRGRTGAFARDFERLIDAPKRLSERILDDPSGEPLVIAARATGMPVAVLQRILVLISPAVHHSVQRVYELTELYHAVGGGTARDLLAVWRTAALTATGGETAPAMVTNMGARFRALSARIESKAITSRPGPESADQRGPPSR
jgi:hypothetical protein